MSRTDELPKSGRLQVGDLLVDLGTHEVSRDGTPIRIPTLSYRLLLVLATSAPNVVSHDDLVDMVWEGTIVSPETVTQRIKLLRQALGDDAKSPRYIGLVRGAGYRILVEVSAIDASLPRNEPLAGPDASQPGIPGSRRWIAVGAIALVFIAGAAIWQTSRPPALLDNGVAVVPLLFPESIELDDQDLGLLIDISKQLELTSGLQVPSPRTSFALSTELDDTREIARRLGMRWLIEPMVNLSGGELALTLRITDGASGVVVRSFPTIEIGNDDLSLLRTKEELLAELVPALSDLTGINLVAPSAATQNDLAYEIFLSALALEKEVREAQLVDETKLARVIELYRSATRQDPEFVRAFARLASSLIYQGDVNSAGPVIERALEIEDNDSEVQYVLGLYRWWLGDELAGEAFARAVELNPNNVDALWELAKWIWHDPIIDLPGEYFRHAIELDGQTLSRYLDLGNFYGISGMRDEALEIAREVEQRFPNPDGYAVLARIYEVAGDLDEAIAWATRLSLQRPESPEAGWLLGYLYARIHDPEMARQFDQEAGLGHLLFARDYETLVDNAEWLMIENPDDLKIRYLLAFAHNATGNPEAARYILRNDDVDLPARALGRARKADAVEALMFLADAELALGNVDEAQEIAQWIVAFMGKHFESGGEKSWWPILYQACGLALLEEDDFALERLERLLSTPGLPWFPMLVDSPCFGRFADEPRFHAVVAAISARIDVYRERLPIAFSQHGLTPSISSN